MAEKLLKKYQAALLILEFNEKKWGQFKVTNAESYEELIVGKTELKEHWTKFKTNLENLLENAPDSDVDLSTMDRYLKIVSHVNHLIEKNVNFAPPSQVERDSRNMDHGNVWSHSTNLRLPPLPTPVFSGKFSEWTNFRETFTALIIDNPSLNDVERFHYLTQAVEGDAVSIIQGLACTPENFKVAWENLELRYNNPRLLAQSYVKGIIHAPEIKKNSPESIRTFIDAASTNFKALKALDLQVDMAEFLVVHLLMRQLPVFLLREWEISCPIDRNATMKDLLTFLERRYHMEELSAVDVSYGPSARSQNVRASNAFPPSFKEQPCRLCGATHALFQCSLFKGMSPSDMYAHVKRIKACFNCLKPFTPDHKCSHFNCRVCGAKHNTLLHEAFAKPSRYPAATTAHIVDVTTGRDRTSSSSRSWTTPIPPGSTTPRNGCTNYMNTQPCPRSERIAENNQSQLRDIDDDIRQTGVSITSLIAEMSDKTITTSILPTALVSVRRSDSSIMTCRALLDTGSSANLISQKVAHQLGLSAKRTSKVAINTICDVTAETTQILTMEIASLYTTWNSNETFLVVPNVSLRAPTVDSDAEQLQIPPDIFLADPDFHTGEPIDLLLGSAVFVKVLQAQRLSLGTGRPDLISTKLGWIVLGECTQNQPSFVTTVQSNFIQVSNLPNVKDELTRFWTLEETQLAPKLKPEEEFCERHYSSTVCRLTDGRYQVSLPFMGDVNGLGDSRPQALRRLLSLEKRFAKNLLFRNEYKLVVDDYINSGHMYPVPPPRPGQVTYYLPHHAVFKEESTTTKLRVVFDGSAKTTNGCSLNDLLALGPQVQPDLFTILVRFRLFPIAIVADVAKMFRQINVQADQHDLQRVLWRPDSDGPIIDYCLSTLSFGQKASPFLATRTLNQLAADEEETFPDLTNIVQSNVYVDNLLTGAHKIEDAKRLIMQLQDLFDRGKLPLRKWLSNSKEALQVVPPELQEKGPSRMIGDSEQSTISTLGMIWDSKSDQFTLNYTSTSLENVNCTMRQVLSHIARVFDPLGLVSPVVIKSKMFMQTLWKNNIKWDDKLTEDLLKLWLMIRNELVELTQICAPRCVITNSQTKLEIHGFADASCLAYGACVYVKSINSEGEQMTRLVCSKSRVAPIKERAIPQLELCASLVLSRLIHKIVPCFQVEPNMVYLYTDSTVVATWISTPTYKRIPFVSIRVSEIQELTCQYNWKHVRSTENPADLISRGCTVEELKANRFWWQGPDFIKEETPCQEVDSIVVATQIAQTIRRDFQVEFFTPIIQQLLERHSKLSKILRIVAYCLRFIHNLRHPDNTRSGVLQPSSIAEAETLIVKTIQATHYSKEHRSLSQGGDISPKSTLASLNPIIIDGIIRVGGRLQQADIPFDAKHQVIIPQKSKYTKLLIQETHLRLLHAGAQLVTADIRRKYWIPSIRHTIRNTIRSCIPCIRLCKAKNEQLMGQLPKERISPSLPFETCGLDYLGPIPIKLGTSRSRIITKAFVALFVCMATRAVHCEVVTDLSTQAFLAAFNRFISRRGIPSLMFSDNATNFRKASKELAEIHALFSEESNQQTIQDATVHLRVEWRFIPPRSPHCGGLWEAAVKSFKKLFRPTIGKRILKLEELITLSTTIEAILNSRPIAPISDDHNDLNFLTPSHLLMQKCVTTLPLLQKAESNIDCLTRWKRVQSLTQNFWEQWSRHYLLTLQRSQKWNSARNNLKIGDVVLLREERLPPCHWKMGKIVQTFPGRDNRIRVVLVRTSTGIYKRNIHYLVPLPIETGN